MKIYLARQAIYNRDEKIVAYEILYRSSLKNLFDGNVEDEEATYKVIQNISSFGLGELTDNKPAFINFSSGVINRNMATLLPKEKIVIEVLESVKPTKEIIQNLKNLKKRGYHIALDDITTYEKVEGFIEVVDIVKIDYKLSDKYERFKISQKLKGKKIKVLAEKVETKGEVEEAKSLGFDYFQGYYFSKPKVLQSEELEVKNGTIFNIIIELLKEEFDINKIEELIKYDIGLTYKFLKFINSAYFNFMQEVSSIKFAVMLVGKNELRKWLSIISISEINSSNGNEYLKNTLVRARMCEIISEKELGCDKNSAFMVGLFSNIHMLMEKSLDELVSQLPVNKEVKEALVGKDNIYKNILDLTICYEEIELKKESLEKNGANTSLEIDMDMDMDMDVDDENINYEKLNVLIKKLGLNMEIVEETYIESTNWSLNIAHIDS